MVGTIRFYQEGESFLFSFHSKKEDNLCIKETIYVFSSSAFAASVLLLAATMQEGETIQFKIMKK